MTLKIQNISYKHSSKFSLNNINLAFDNNVTAIIGPNGSGKSTLIKCIVNIYKCDGEMYYQGEKLNKQKKEFIKQKVGYLPQTSQNDASITVFEAVLLGLMNTLTLKVNKKQEQKVNDILDAFELQHLAKNKINELSGGQLQMVLLAQSIIKEPEVLILDEPLNNLDIHRQFSLLNTISNLAYEKKMIVIIVMHDINLASRYADNIVVMKEGKVYSHGTPEKVLTKEMVREIYKIDSEIYVNKQGKQVIEFVDIFAETDKYKLVSQI
ncbi:ABC transporter ATP-binding protein [Clostridium sp. BL-8]|uniref:ABC transporter ATP-binding protein n=1 Tax=Clostridium sp. BL-8 TaxID=349938 RepID=UPI00098C5449|nr:ABC transporter ATP-binding protein [Clostridium sp. BL-8]OOM79534.1 iron(3+)-hydroxamate import ATP-binding protein FhuC [Clostridium sp. BL-8]